MKKVIAILGTIMQIGPIYGLIITFNSFRNSLGNNDPNLMKDQISIAIDSSMDGIVLGFIGLILILIALLKFKYKAKWFYNTTQLTALIYIFSFPIGTVIGIFLLVYLLFHKKDFNIGTNTES